MRDTSLLQLALGIMPPWSVTRSGFDKPQRAGSISKSTLPPAAGLPAPPAAHPTARLTIPSK